MNQAETVSSNAGTLQSRRPKAGPEPEAAGSAFGAAAFGISLLVYLAVCFSILRHSVSWLLGYVADDGFYYLQIARHLAATGHSTFDGLNPTNGYHPGWMLLMTGLARLFPDRVALLKASLGLEFGFQLATSLMLLPIMRRLSGPFWAWIAAAAWLLNPLPFTLALFGVEAPFAQFAVVVSVWVYLSRIAPFLRPGQEFRPPAAGLILFGLGLALAFYGRTDQALLAVMAVLLLLGFILKWTPPVLRFASCGRVLLWVGGTSAVAVLPWYLFSYAACGTLSQDSGAMKMLWHARSIPGWNIHTLVTAPLRFLTLFWLATPFATLLTGSFPGRPAITGTALLLILLVVAALWRAAKSLSQTDGTRLSEGETSSMQFNSTASFAFAALTIWLGSAYLLLGVLYGVLIDDSQFWHLAVPSITLFLLLTAWGAHIAHRRMPQAAQRRLGAALLAAALGVCVWHRVQMTPPYPWQRDVYASQPRFEALVPASARIGCFDAGIPAYFSPRTIINLDGLVNHTAVPYWKSGTLDRYVAAQGVEYIANEPLAVAHAQTFTEAPIPLTLIATAPLKGWSAGKRCFWKVESRKTGGREQKTGGRK